MGHALSELAERAHDGCTSNVSVNKKKQEEGQQQPTAALLPVSVTRKAEREGGGGVKNVTKECSMMTNTIRPKT